MRVLTFLVFSFFGVLFFTSGTVSAEESSEQNKKPYSNKQVVIKSGDTLIKIANENKTTYPRLFDANPKIKNPDIIHPGDKVRIPHKDEELKKRELPSSIVAQAPVAYGSAPTPAYQRPVQNPQPVPATTSVGSGVWDRLAACESGGNWSINTGNGYYGGLQFNLGTWRSNGGSGYPHQASKAEQIRVAENLRAARGFSPWPACSAKLGLR
ncbi:MAG: transglycosylase family protein [Paracoccus sp. (in: a-proteobacteria)]